MATARGASGDQAWDAATYDRIADPQEEWGREVLERLELSGEETVLDAGCGSGRVTALLAERLPRGRVIGVDGSAEMIAQAREALQDRVELIVADLVELELPEPVDAIFSNATLHWIMDHDRLFDNLASLLRAGGALEAQCGGIGNVAELQQVITAKSGDERFAAYLRGRAQPWNFASVGDTEARLERAGFERARCWLERRTVEPPDPREYVRGSALAAHLVHLPPELHEPFVDAVVGSMMRPVRIEYVRLNISARRSG